MPTPCTPDLTLTRTEQSYFISSRAMKAAEMSHLVRAHWGIENRLHWVLDVSWGEDAQQTRDKAAAQNLACVRKITLNLARMEQQQRPKRVSLKNIRNLAAWDIDVRESILGLAGSGSLCGGPVADRLPCGYCLPIISAGFTHSSNCASVT
ncbi:MAG: ISAs1 family transposase [Burkholderia sp.]